jgi:hypothetical protein
MQFSVVRLMINKVVFATFPLGCFVPLPVLLPRELFDFRLDHADLVLILRCVGRCFLCCANATSPRSKQQQRHYYQFTCGLRQRVWRIFRGSLVVSNPTSSTKSAIVNYIYVPFVRWWWMAELCSKRDTVCCVWRRQRAEQGVQLRWQCRSHPQSSIFSVRDYCGRNWDC